MYAGRILLPQSLQPNCLRMRLAEPWRAIGIKDEIRSIRRLSAALRIPTAAMTRPICASMQRNAASPLRITRAVYASARLLPSHYGDGSLVLRTDGPLPTIGVIPATVQRRAAVLYITATERKEHKSVVSLPPRSPNGRSATTKAMLAAQLPDAVQRASLRTLRRNRTGLEAPLPSAALAARADQGRILESVPAIRDPLRCGRFPLTRPRLPRRASQFVGGARLHSQDNASVRSARRSACRAGTASVMTDRHAVVPPCHGFCA